jgi:hypothetical protein
VGDSHYTLGRLIELTKIVDASVFIFGEDDKVWYHDSQNQQPRDNVLLEYGLFASRLGLSRNVVSRINRSILSDNRNIIAGTLLNGYQPVRRIIPASDLNRWIEKSSLRTPPSPGSLLDVSGS